MAERERFNTFKAGDRVTVHGFPFRDGATGTVEKYPNGLIEHTVTVNMDSDRTSYPCKPSELERMPDERTTDAA